jgi:hypothetical protein
MPRFLLVVVAQLLLIWAYPRTPTQDGPVHVASAIAFRDLGEPGTSYTTLFERRFLLWPLGAWRLAGVVGANRTTLSGVALLIAFERSLWLGFYNYLLGVALAFLVVARVEARREGKTARDVAVSVRAAGPSPVWPVPEPGDSMEAPSKGASRP